MSFEEIMGELKNKVYRPVYYLMGEESYYIDEITNYIAGNVLTEQEKDFNQTILYGKDVNIPAILGVARKFPMMANYQVVVVKEAQNVAGINGKDTGEEQGSSKKYRASDAFLLYVQKPLKSTILVINYRYGTINKKLKLYQAINETGVIFESKKLYDNQIPAWVAAFLKHRNVAIEPEAIILLCDYLGTDLGKIANELNKLIICLPTPDAKITTSQIELNIGISKEYNVFELRKALANKNTYKANQIVNYFANNLKDNPLIIILTSLFQFFTKVLVYHQLADKSRQNASAEMSIPVYFIYDFESAAKKYSAAKIIQVISLIRQYDLKSKGVDNNSTSEGDLLKELIYKILH